MPGVDQTYVPTKFQWSQNWGNHVCMAGSFDPPIPTWSPLEMKKNKDNIYELTLDLLPDKKYYFKFVIDGNWILDQGLHSCPDSSGNYNHEIQVNLPPRPPTPVIVEQQQEVEDVKVDEENHQVIVTETETTEEHNQVIIEDHKEVHHHDHPAIEDNKIEHQEDHIVDEEQIQHQGDHHENNQHQEEQVVQEQVVVEEQVVVVEEQVVVVEEQVIVVQEQVVEVAKEEHHHQEDHQIVTEDHHADENKQQYLEGQVAEEIKEEHHHQEDHIVTEDHHADENKQHYLEGQVVEEIKEEHHHHQEDHIVTEDHHADEVVEEIKEQHHHHQEDHIVTEDHHADEVVEEIKEQHHHHQEDHHIAAGTDENKQQYQEEQIQHQEDLQVVEDLHEHHHEDEQKEQDVTDMNTTEQSRDDTVTNVSISEAIETETIINETMVEQSDLSKETMIESDNDKLSAEHVANTTDNVIIEGTHDESMTTESDETLHTPQDDTDKVTEISEIERPNIEQSDSEIKITENNEIKVTENNEIKVTENNENKVTEETSSIVEKHETVVSSTTETEIPIESSTDEIKVEGEGEKYEHKRETMNENEDDDYDDYERDEGAEDSENTIVVYEENLNEETLKEVLLNNTWAKDDNSLEDCIPSSWTEVHQSQSVIWPDDTNLKWSDINKETSDEPEETETTNKLETEVEDYLDYLEHEETHVEITSNDEEEVVSCEISSTVLVEETITVKPGSIVEEIFAQSIVGSHIEKESDEIGINNKVPTEPSFAQYEKPESSATADKNISALLSIPTTVVAEAAVEQHSYLDEEKAIDNSEMEDVLQDNISRKIISISPNASSPGESTRNADIYPRITVATNTSLSETVNIKSKHKKPVVEITSRGILQKDSKTIIQDEEEEEKIDLVNISYLVTSVTTTFTLGVISMLYKSVFKPRNQ